MTPIVIPDARISVRSGNQGRHARAFQHAAPGFRLHAFWAPAGI